MLRRTAEPGRRRRPQSKTLFGPWATSVVWVLVPSACGGDNRLSTGVWRGAVGRCEGAASRATGVRGLGQRARVAASEATKVREGDVASSCLDGIDASDHLRRLKHGLIRRSERLLGFCQAPSKLIDTRVPFTEAVN